jgi:hypothetical protein
VHCAASLRTDVDKSAFTLSKENIIVSIQRFGFHFENLNVRDPNAATIFSSRPALVSHPQNALLNQNRDFRQILSVVSTSSITSIIIVTAFTIIEVLFGIIIIA